MYCDIDNISIRHVQIYPGASAEGIGIIPGESESLAGWYVVCPCNQESQYCIRIVLDKPAAGTEVVNDNAVKPVMPVLICCCE